MNVTDRQAHEIAFHDRQARSRRLTFRTDPAALHVDEHAYLDHESWIRPAFAQLGEVGGLDVLDWGCGHGMAAVLLARRGARVTALDLSQGYLDEARNRAIANAASITFVRANAEQMPFADGTFDRVWGNAILHHLDLRQATTELRRVLRPGGWAVLCEPWGDNPLLACARAHAGCHTPDERPLGHRHVRVMRELFPVLEVRGFQLLSMAGRLLGRGQLTSGLERGDAWLLSTFPSLRWWCRYMVLTLRS